MQRVRRTSGGEIEPVSSNGGDVQCEGYTVEETLPSGMLETIRTRDISLLDHTAALEREGEDAMNKNEQEERIADEGAGTRKTKRKRKHDDAGSGQGSKKQQQTKQVHRIHSRIPLVGVAEQNAEDDELVAAWREQTGGRFDEVFQTSRGLGASSAYYRMEKMWETMDRSIKLWTTEERAHRELSYNTLNGTLPNGSSTDIKVAEDGFIKRKPVASGDSPAVPQKNAARWVYIPAVIRAAHTIVGQAGPHDRAEAAPELPKGWDARYDRALCVMEVRGWSYESMISKIRPGFGEMVAITPAMIDQRIRQLDNDVGCTFFQ